MPKKMVCWLCVILNNQFYRQNALIKLSVHFFNKINSKHTQKQTFTHSGSNEQLIQGDKARSVQVVHKGFDNAVVII